MSTDINMTGYISWHDRSATGSAIPDNQLTKDSAPSNKEAKTQVCRCVHNDKYLFQSSLFFSLLLYTFYQCM
jgi:hypothetical protein